MPVQSLNWYSALLRFASCLHGVSRHECDGVETFVPLRGIMDITMELGNHPEGSYADADDSTNYSEVILCL